MNENPHTDLFPPIEPYRHGFLPAQDGHSVYFEECGSAKGLPVVFLHGGPGSGCGPKHRQLFNPRSTRVVLFDQRGCGQSTPHAELAENTTWDLVSDMEVLRQHLKIERWQVVGGSWGSTPGICCNGNGFSRIGLFLRDISSVNHCIQNIIATILGAFRILSWIKTGGFCTNPARVAA